MADQIKLIEVIRARILTMPSANGMTPEHVSRRFVPSKETPKLLPFIALYLAPKLTETWADIDNVDLCVEIYGDSPITVEQIASEVANRAHGLHLYETSTNGIVIWKCRHEGGLPNPQKDEASNLFVADAQFAITYG